MKRSITLVIISLYSLILNAQKFDFNHSPEWLEKPQKHTADPSFSTASAVAIVDDRKTEFRSGAKEVELYQTYHRIYKINDDKGIEMFNKIYVPVYPNSKIIELKARTILPDGKIINIAKEKIKETEEEGRLYKLFAMEGVEKGAEVEYSYTVQRSPVFFGTEVFQSASTPIQKAFFTLIVPSYLKFDAKGINGFKISSDSVIKEQRIIVGYDEKISEIDEEKYAVRDPFMERVEYKLSYNISANPEARVYTWKGFAKNAYSMYTTISDKEEKPLVLFASAIKTEAMSSTEDKIRGIEDYIKSSINIDKNLVGEEGGNIEKIVKKKSSNEQGIIRLFAGVFDKSGINYQLVFVSKRDDAPIMEDFENWNLLDDVVFYFPDTKKYLAPAIVELRYPYIPAYWAGTKGLFLKGTSLGSFKTAIGSIGNIEMMPYENNKHDMEATVKFDKTMDTLLIESKQIFTGYGAANYRPVYNFLPKEKQDQVSFEILKAVSNSSNIKNIKVENPSLSNYFENKPLIISAEVKSNEMIERAGDKILLKIGEIIGPQEQMYQEKPRKLPVEMEYPHRLFRHIVLEVPAGYKVKNLSDLNMNVEHKDGSESTMSFTSTYKQSGNLITLDVNESYKRFRYPLEQFEDFRKVINASADFNKIVLVLEKVK